MSGRSPPPQRPDGTSRGAAREWLEKERRRAEPAAFFYSGASKQGEKASKRKSGSIIFGTYGVCFVLSEFVFDGLLSSGLNPFVRLLVLAAIVYGVIAAKRMVRGRRASAI